MHFFSSDVTISVSSIWLCFFALFHPLQVFLATHSETHNLWYFMLFE